MEVRWIFQSTRSQRPRRLHKTIVVCHGWISIHEVAKTSTRLESCTLVAVVFQSTRSQRPRRTSPFQLHAPGCISIHEVAKTSTRNGNREYREGGIFQSTRSQRPRPLCLYLCPPGLYFNPRGRKDLDVPPTKTWSTRLVFQSTRSQRPRQQIPPKTKSLPLQNLYLLYNHPTIISTK